MPVSVQHWVWQPHRLLAIACGHSCGSWKRGVSYRSLRLAPLFAHEHNHISFVKWLTRLCRLRNDVFRTELASSAWVSLAVVLGRCNVAPRRTFRLLLSDRRLDLLRRKQRDSREAKDEDSGVHERRRRLHALFACIFAPPFTFTTLFSFLLVPPNAHQHVFSRSPLSC